MRMRVCANCRKAHGSTYRSLCLACYQYQWIHGKPRPRYLSQDTCRICRRPRQPKRQIKGRCQICHNYHLRYGRDRSKELIQRHAPYGWCDCGKPAATVLTLSVSHSSDAFPLCKECAQLEQAS